MENNKNSNRDVASANAGGMNREKVTQNEGVSKKTLTTAVIGLVILIAAGLVFFTISSNKNRKQLSMIEEENKLFAGQLSTRDSVINDWILTFNQIEKDLETIRQQQNLIEIESSDEDFSMDRKQQIVNDIRYINTLLDQNRERIASLSAELRNSGVAIKGLQDKVADLETSIEQREMEISELKLALIDREFEIDSLNSRMTDMEVIIAEQDDKINNQTNTMNTAYLVYSTYENLKERGIVTKEGGFLGLGKKKSLQEDFADSSFLQVNITETTTIPVNSKEIELITEHPSGSYELIREEDKIAYIEIKNPDEFWKISKYAVVAIDGK